MGAPRKIEPEIVRRMWIVEKLTDREVAERVGLSYSRIRNLRRELGIPPRTLSHKLAVPWVIATKHSSSKVHKYLIVLSQVAQQKADIDRDMVVTAYRWASNLVDRNLDIDYDPEVAPNNESIVGGFFTKPVDGDWHLKTVLNRAKAEVPRYT